MTYPEPPTEPDPERDDTERPDDQETPEDYGDDWPKRNVYDNYIDTLTDADAWWWAQGFLKP